MDNIISSNLISFSRFRIDLRKRMQFEFKDSTEVFITKVTSETLNTLLQSGESVNMTSYNTLMNYDALISKIENIQASSFDMLITSQELPKFINRNQLLYTAYRPTENLLFRSERNDLLDYEYRYAPR